MRRDEITVYSGMLFKKYNNKYYCSGAFGRYIDELSKLYLKMYLCVPVQEVDENEEINDYEIKSTNIIVQELPAYDGFIDSIKKSVIISKKIKEFAQSWEGIVYIRWPVPFSYYIYKTVKKMGLPICFHLVGDTKAVVLHGDKYKGIKKILAVKYSELNEYLMKKMLFDSPAIVNGSGLRRLYPTKGDHTIKEIRTSTFFKKEIYYRNEDLDKENIRLLYVGYMRHEKGLNFLLEAVKMLIDEGYNIKLTLVGEGEELSKLKEMTLKLNVVENVIFKGHIALGTKLFSVYKENDIFILPSISEGTPRVLLEAMCNGLPVIATNTGGIPFTIRDRQNGLLIPPKDSNAIKNAVKLLINDNSFRKKIISNGYICAENNTLEKHIQEVNSFIQDNCLKNNANKTILEHSFLTKVKRVIFRSIPIHIVMLITSLLPNSKVTNRIRGLLLKPFFKSCGKNLQVASGVIINVPENISIGNDVYIAHNAWINGAGGLIIENNVVIGPYSVIATTKHIFEDRCVNNTKSEVAPIRIGKGCWIASHAVITSGVTIGNGVLISAGAVVTKDLESDIMVGGVPAKFIRNM